MEDSMSEDEKLSIAKEYIDRQLQTMREGGAVAANISEEEYKALIEEAAEVIRS